ncbi:hypothetical protein BCEP27_80067 [Burkholderia cepacia]
MLGDWPASEPGERGAPIESKRNEAIARKGWTRVVVRARRTHLRGVSATAALPLTACVDPAPCPAGRVPQCLRFAREVIERIELVAAFRGCAVGTFEHQVG